MSLIKNVSFTFIIITAIVLNVGYVLADLWRYTGLISGIGLIWLITTWRGWSWFNSAGLVLVMGIAVWGIWLEISTTWLLLGVIAALMAWDLVRFQHRLLGLVQSEETTQLEQAHLQRLLFVGTIGVALGSIATNIQISLNFGWAVFLALIMTTTLSTVVAFIRRLNE